MERLKSVVARRPQNQSPKPGEVSQLPSRLKTQYGFKIWHDPNDSAGRHSHIFDLVFVHGLTGDREHTWTHPESAEPWPKMLISEEFPEARILSYGYDAYVALKKGPVSSNRLSSHSLDFLNAIIAIRQTRGSEPRPLIFVAHSLGGIVCKDALLQSSNSIDLTKKAVFNDTVGLIFMGTPHTGAGLAWWAKVPAHALGVVKSTNKKLLEVLETENEILSRIQNDFMEKIRSTVNTSNEIQIVCFYETLPMHSLLQIVSFESAILPGYNHISIHADHKNMVKILSKNDNSFVQFSGILRRWKNWATEKVASIGLSIDRIEKYREQCLRSLSFPEMRYRRSDISSPIPDTCDWILEDKFYTQWTATPPNRSGTDEFHTGDKSGPDLLFISGKPGSGKSTLMKKLFEIHTKRQKTLDGTCLGFFFNARGAVLERSPLGLYRSLLFQLVLSNPIAFRIIFPTLREKEAMREPSEKEAMSKSSEFEWHHSEISEQLYKILNDERVRNVIIFVDGMDECEDNDAARDIVTSFEHSLQISQKTVSNLRICLSSRPYRQIRPKWAPELKIEARNSSDIALYVDRELVLPNYGDIGEIKTQTVGKASGVFLWVVLVVKRLRTAWDKGSLPRQIRQILEELPPKLEDLYSHIVGSMTEEQLKLTSQIAHLVLFVKTPLSPNDLDIILALTSGPSEHSLIEIASNSPINTQALSRFRAYLTEATGGLFEVSMSTSTMFVQVIHETVRGFLRSVGAQDLHRRASRTFENDTIHEAISLAIRNYALSSEIRASFTSSIGGHPNTTDWIGFCERSPPQNFHLLSQAAPKYFVLHGIEHIRDKEQHPYTPKRGSELITEVEGWLFAFAMMSLRASDRKIPDAELSYYNRTEAQAPKSAQIAQEYLSFINKHSSSLGLNEREIERMATCMNNRSTFLDIAANLGEQFESMRRQPVYKFHLACWAMSDEEVSVVREVEFLDRKRRAVVDEGPAVTPYEATCICSEHSAGMAFTASFSWTKDTADSGCIPADWIIREDYGEFFRLLGQDPDKVEDNLANQMPFHLNEENGYIALIVIQECRAEADKQNELRPPKVVAVIEKEDSETWRLEYFNRDVSIDTRPPEKRLHSKASVSSMRTNVPGRGSSTWYARDKLQDKGKAKVAELGSGDFCKQKRFPSDKTPGLTVESLRQLQSDLKKKGLG